MLSLRLQQLHTGQLSQKLFLFILQEPVSAQKNMRSPGEVKV